MAARVRLASFALLLLAIGAVGVLLASNTSAADPNGDATCDGITDSVDAALILQLHAALIKSAPCMGQGDVNQDGSVDSIDAALVLQSAAGLIPYIGPTPTVTTPTPTVPTATPTPLFLDAQFSMKADIDGDASDDCTTGIPGHDICSLEKNQALTVKVSLDQLPLSPPNYDGFDIVLMYSGLATSGEPSAQSWPDCSFQAVSMSSGQVAVGCTIGVPEDETSPPLLPSTYLGVIAVATFTAVCEDSRVSLVHGPFATSLTDRNLKKHVEALSGEETLRFICSP